MTTTALDVVLEDIEARRDSIAQAVISGSAKDYAEYKHMCGEIQGLLRTHAFIVDLVRKMENDDE